MQSLQKTYKRRKAFQGIANTIQQIDMQEALDAIQGQAKATNHDSVAFYQMLGRALLLGSGVIAALALAGWLSVVLLQWLIANPLFSDYTDVERSNQLVELGKDERAMAAESAAFYGM